jgi:hypothetical protein
MHDEKDPDFEEAPEKKGASRKGLFGDRLGGLIDENFLPPLPMDWAYVRSKRGVVYHVRRRFYQDLEKCFRHEWMSWSFCGRVKDPDKWFTIQEEWQPGMRICRRCLHKMGNGDPFEVKMSLPPEVRKWEAKKKREEKFNLLQREVLQEVIDGRLPPSALKAFFPVEYLDPWP